jgi:hypothetical protein
VLLTPDELFDHLMSCQELISYRNAYGKLVGPPPPRGSWRNRIHCRPVLDEATQSSSRVANGLRIRLDALIVNQRDREPSGGYFNGTGYDPARWRAAFGAWPLCKHS